MLFFLRTVRRKLLQRNELSTYLLYAVGEIILVVVGILIAVYIDNWNEQNKEDALALKYKVQMKEDLQKDTAYFNSYYQYVINERLFFDSLKTKVSQPSTDFDTLKLIAKQFNPFLRVWAGLNNGTYNTIEAAGNWHVFSDDFVQDITGLKLLQDQAEETMTLQLNLFVDRQLAHGLKYPTNPPFMFLGQGPFNDYLWKDPSKKDFVVSINSLVTVKAIYMREALNRLRLLNRISEQILEKHFKDI